MQFRERTDPGLVQILPDSLLNDYHVPINALQILRGNWRFLLYLLLSFGLRQDL